MLRISQLTVLIGLMCFSQFVIAGSIYKCKDADGQISFSQKPCSRDTQQIRHKKSSSPRQTSSSSAKPLGKNNIIFADKQVTHFIKALATEVKIKKSYLTAKNGLYVPWQGSRRLVPFAKLKSIEVMEHANESCGNTGHLCDALVKIITTTGEYQVKYDALRNIKVIIDDELTGERQELKPWFGQYGKTNIKKIIFGDDKSTLNDIKVANKNDSIRSGTIYRTKGVPIHFKELVKTEVRLNKSYRTAKKGIYIPFEGSHRLLPASHLKQLEVLYHGKNTCGNLAHLCDAKVRVSTKTSSYQVDYAALRNIRIIDRSGKEQTIWFANKKKGNIKRIVMN